MTDILQIDVGTQPNQVPTVGDLGDLAFMDRSHLDAKITGVVQSTPGDTTPGAILKVGSFGLGGDGVVSSEVDLNLYRKGGTYITPLSGVLNLPAGWTGGRYNVIVGAALNGTAYCAQIIIMTGIQSQYPSKIAFRWMYGDNDWGPWSELTQSKDIGTAATKNFGTAAGNLMEVGSFGLGVDSTIYQTTLATFDAHPASGFYLAYGATVPSLATPGAPDGSGSNIMGVIANTGKYSTNSAYTYYLATENAPNNATRRMWFGQRYTTNGVPSPLLWTQLVTSDQQNPDWLSPTLQNSWTAYSTTYEPQYRKTSSYIELKGMVSNTGTLPKTTIFTLPVGYRPIRPCVLSTMGYSSTAADLFLVYVNITTDGQVIVNTYSKAASGAISWISFDNVRVPLN